MLSKAYKLSCKLPFAVYPKLPVTPYCYKGFPLLQTAPLGFSQVPKFYFSNEKNPNESSQTPLKKSKKPTKIEQDEEADSTRPRESFIEFMQKQETLSKNLYQYNNKILYKVHTNREDFTKRYLFYMGMGTIWLVVSYLTFQYINPWVAIIPIWFLTGSLISIRMISKFSKGMIKQIELVDNRHINIYPLNLKGKPVLCDIDKTEVLGIKVMSETPQESGESIIKSYLIMANFTESAKKKSYAKMRLLIDPSMTSVANLDLLKSVLYGQVEEVDKFEFVEKVSEEGELNVEEKKERETLDDAEGKAKFEFKEEEFDELRRQFNRDVDSSKSEESKKNDK